MSPDGTEHRRAKMREYQRAYYQRTREKQLARSKTPKKREYQKRRYQETKVQRLAYRMKRAYGMSAAGYAAMFAAQGGSCAICRTPQLCDGPRRAVVDHDHGTGAVRGLLCSSCNLMLGHAKDSSRVLAAAITYLQSQKP